MRSSADQSSEAQLRSSDTISMPLDILVRRIFIAHLLIILGLILAHLLFAIVLGASVGITGNVFDPEYETSIPNFFSAVMLVITSLATFGVAAYEWSANRKLSLYWLAAGLMILFLGIDEGAGLHDRIGFRTQEALGTSGAFFMGWTLLYLGLVLVVIAAGIPFLRSLPRATLIRLVIASAVFVGAALGLEMIEGILLERNAPPGATFKEALDAGVPEGWGLLIAIEEFGEMLAVALALRAVLLHLKERGVSHVAIFRTVAGMGKARGMATLATP